MALILFCEKQGLQGSITLNLTELDILFQTIGNKHPLRDSLDKLMIILNVTKFHGAWTNFEPISFWKRTERQYFQVLEYVDRL